MVKFLGVYLAVFAATVLGVEMFRRWSLRREILDVPNERSSHSVPTPRGGGLIIFLVSIFTFFIYQQISGGLVFWGYYAGALIVAAISLLDDVRAVSPLVRFLFHSLAAVAAVWFFGGFGTISIPFGGIVESGLWGDLLAFFWIVWLINAYNFMDGIDGIAAMQALTAGFGWSLAGWFWGIEFLWFFGGILVFSSLGFILLNWQPAKIFMGDVGSAFLGYSFAVMPLLAKDTLVETNQASNLIWVAVIFVWFFVFDSVFTLFRRLLRGEKVWEAHRRHIYQRLVILGIGHAFVTCLYGIFSVIAVLATTLALKLPLDFWKTVFIIIGFETLLLIIYWQWFEQKQNKAGEV